MHDYKRLFGIALTVVSALTAPPAASVLAAAETTSVPLPFDTGASVQIVQGYNGGTHQGASVYGLDLVLTNGETSGAAVLAPFDGTVPWAFAPGEKTEPKSNVSGSTPITVVGEPFRLIACPTISGLPANWRIQKA